MGGIDVRILLPHKSDSWLTQWCSRSYVEELLEAGVKVYWYQKGINHSKVIVVDGMMASVGTANMDMRSFDENFEVNLIIYDRNVAKNLAASEAAENTGVCGTFVCSFAVIRPGFRLFFLRMVFLII